MTLQASILKYPFAGGTADGADPHVVSSGFL